MPITEDEAREIAGKLLNVELDDIHYPGGKSRESLKADIGGNSIIVTKRKHLGRAKLESLALRFLNLGSAPVPRLIAYSNHYLIQQDVGSERLSVALQSVGEHKQENLLKSAICGLEKIHLAGASSRVAQSIVVLGNTEKWIHNFIRSTERVGSLTSIQPPDVSYSRITKLLTVPKPQFIKWDARPGNAIVRGDKSVYWIDWEHCGRRHPLDDLAWLMNDEFMPFNEGLQERCISQAIEQFGYNLSRAEAKEYYSVFSVLHSCIRLELILSYHSKNGWWDMDYCLRFDKVGVVRELALNTINRAMKLSHESDSISQLSNWFQQLYENISELS